MNRAFLFYSVIVSVLTTGLLYAGDVRSHKIVKEEAEWISIMDRNRFASLQLAAMVSSEADKEIIRRLGTRIENSINITLDKLVLKEKLENETRRNNVGEKPNGGKRNYSKNLF
jgi:hypothetical protein